MNRKTQQPNSTASRYVDTLSRLRDDSTTSEVNNRIVHGTGKLHAGSIEAQVSVHIVATLSDIDVAYLRHRRKAILAHRTPMYQM